MDARFKMSDYVFSRKEQIIPQCHGSSNVDVRGSCSRGTKKKYLYIPARSMRVCSWMLGVFVDSETTVKRW